MDSSSITKTTTAAAAHKTEGFKWSKEGLTYFGYGLILLMLFIASLVLTKTYCKERHQKEQHLLNESMSTISQAQEKEVGDAPSENELVLEEPVEKESQVVTSHQMSDEQLQKNTDTETQKIGDKTKVVSRMAV